MDATKTLPASWFTSQNLYSLEQRAVFYKAWYLVGAVPRFAAGEEVEYEFAQVPIVVQQDGNENFEVTRKSDVRVLVAVVPSLSISLTCLRARNSTTI
jgi:hypothetical protein